VATYQTPGGFEDNWVSVGLDAAGNVFAAGSAARSTAPYVSDYSTVKFNPSGTFLWQALYNETGSGSDSATALSLNAEGYVYVTGTTTTTPGDAQDYVTLKYDPNGNQLWATRYDGPGQNTDYPAGPAGMAVDGGDVIVTGTTIGPNGVPGWATVAYVQDAAKLTPASLTFGSQAVDTTSSAQTVTVTNTSEQVLDITEISTAGDFHETNNCPKTLAAKGSCTIQVNFKPTAAGTRTGKLTVCDTWAGSPRTATLTGTGAP